MKYWYSTFLQVLPLCLLFLVMVIFCFPEIGFSQERESPHERDLREQPAPVIVPKTAQRNAPDSYNQLTHVVFGYHPYWISDNAADYYRFDLLTHLAYFSCEIDPATGSPITTYNWLSSTVPARASAAGVSVLLTVTNFGAEANRMLLANPTACDTLCAALVRLLRARDADGVSIDFESVPGDQRGNLIIFFTKLRNALDATGKDMVVSAAVPAVDWSNSWDLAALKDCIDLFFVMCYDYSWSGSSIAGPVAPLRGFTLTIEKTVDWYLSQGVPSSQILLGVPYYGYDWPVQDEQPLSPATGKATARIYSVIPDMLTQFSRQWSESYSVPWIAYRSSVWRQCWYDDTQSLALKYAFAKERRLAGAGIWALGYDGMLPELWEEIRKAFTIPTALNPMLPSTERIDVWPLPVRRGERFAVYTGRHTEEEVCLYDIFGRKVFSTSLLGHASILCPDVAPGVYILRSNAVRGISQRLVIIQ